VKMKTRQEIEASLKYSRKYRALAKEKIETATYGSSERLLAHIDAALWLGRIEAYKEILGMTESEPK
jgi:hypothetical protein